MSLCKKLLNSIMSSLDEGLMVLAIGSGRPSTVEYVNPKFTAIYGFELEELQDKNSVALYKMSDDQKGINQITQAVVDRAPVVLEMQCLKKDGSHFPARISLNFSIKPDGQNDYLVVRSRDISKEREYRDTLIQSNITLAFKNSELQTLATHDGLTSLYNRRFFDSQFERLYGFHVRHHMNLCLAFIDIDFYKQYNDFYGHVAGDKVLCRIAKEMTKTFLRLEDITARYGGDEFVVVSSSVAEQAVVIEHFEALRKRVESLAISHENSPLGIVTLSVGVFVGIPGEDSSPECILSAADEALYTSKAAGRNKTTIYRQPAYQSTGSKRA